MGDDLKKQMKFEANRKSVGVAYLLWILLGGFGVHRFYTGHTKSAVVQLLLLISFVGWIVLFPWLLIDLFLIPGLVRERNVETLELLGYTTEQDADPRPARPQPKPIQTEADRRRAEMLEDLRQTGYRKERPERNPLYR
ncbi:MAG: TM2 domain-containing protein [Erythrobacter sp.]